MSKKSLFVLLSTMLSFACNNNIQLSKEEKGRFEIKNEPQPSGLSSISDIKNLPIPNNFKSVISDNINIESKSKINFDYEPPDNIQSEDDEITVVYKDSYKVRIDKKNKKLKVKSLDEKLIFDLLELNKIIDSKDLGNDDLTDKELDDLHDKVSKEREGIPHLQSIHYYKFDKGVNIKELCNSLKKSPLVRLAYPTPKTFPTSTMTTLGMIQNNENNPSAPSDSAFGYPESTDWYWFNKHKIFKAWNYYGSTTVMPNIAVIDSGFNVNSSEINVGDAYYVSNGSVVSSTLLGNCPNKSCAQELATDNPTRAFSHGSMVASIAGAKKNNSIGLCGVAPGAIITAIKTKSDSGSIAKSIEVASLNSSVDAINISSAMLTTNNLHYPLSQDVAINTKISYAVVSKNKPLVITIGNNEINPYNNPLVTDSLGNMISPVSTDAIVIGGSEPSSNGKQKAWVTDDPSDSSLKGSNYNISENTVSVTASAFNIAFMGFKKSQGIDVYTYASGTSCAAPMISATLGMMRKLNSSATATQLENILAYSSNVYKYDGLSNGSSSKFLGKNLNSSSTNQGTVSGIRDLNTYNALVIAKNIGNYNVITRSYNIDDYVASKNDSSSSVFPYPGGSIDGYGNDFIYGFNSVNNPSYFNFSQYNASGGCTYGYQVYRNSFYNAIAFDKLGGASGVATSTTCNENNWNSTMSYYFN